MDKKLSRKEMIAQYKEAKLDMGVYRIKNVKTGKYLLGSTTDIKNIYNKFEFGAQTSTPGVFPRKLAADITEYGFDNFSIEVLELLDVKPEMTKSEIDEELKLLEDIWRDKLGKGNEY
ncbi:hypothetical protein OXPF_18600 [Oxobacter pfennigii]|uniref:GIY-YIG domain-containing protein n=1 Tax=Oxobacter pfennigii TaxID=36849 RepID=A0A0P8W7X6_9CLOT|nr:GIY-YIG nuclease family protein [Oxobacter pfennigii]KPU44774.1 hypothetical protein OXPF_18600 [Oxobacter pfennigii]